VNPEDAVKALHANARSQLANRILRLLGVCIVAIVISASPAMANGTSSSSFTVGIRVQSVPTPVMTPEQLNARNKALYDEQKRAESMNLPANAGDPVGTQSPGQVTSPTSALAS